MLFPVLLLLGFAAPTVGPAHGTLVVVGGGQLGAEIVDKFISLAGGKDAHVVVIPTAGEDNAPIHPDDSFLLKAGVKHLTILHTRDPKVADSEAFVAPLKSAQAVWIVGGRQWRLADAYLGTRTEKELWGVLERGGVIGGSSAGATIQGSYLVRGAVEGNAVMMSPGHEKGFGFLRGVAVDQHLITRHREKDMLPVIEKHPDLLGIGLDESTAIVVTGDQFEVIGKSKVAIYDNPKNFYWLNPGDRFDLKQRRRAE
jgi:cyanophycinase